MQDLIKKIGRFIENHVEKIVLVIVGVVCAALFFRSVIFSPNVVQVGDKGLVPSDDGWSWSSQELNATSNKRR
jgi:hypothetical protein